jgi:alpha-mannosidase
MAFQKIKLPMHWGRMFEYTWFKVSDLAPDAHRRWLRWQDQAEATLYVSGLPHYGFDVAHRMAPIPSGCSEAWVQSVCCQSAIWHPAATGLDSQGSRFAAAEVVRRNEAAWSAYHALSVLYDLALEELKGVDGLAAAAVNRPGARDGLGSAPHRLRRLLLALDQAADAYDVGGLPALSKKLASIYAAFPADGDALRARLLGHAHIDLVWLWPEHVGEAKAIHTFATMNRLLEAYPEMRFSYSQPASYEAVTRISPRLMEAVKRRVKAGQWEATGATYVESDTLLACGEALLRSFQLGQEWFQGANGKPARVLWLPDVFGYSGCIPQLARMSGVESFFTNKQTWSRITPFPHSSFVWRGTDGSELVAHVSHETQQFYNGATTIRELRDGGCDHRQSDRHAEFLVPTGYGDGGGGPTEEMCERARRLRDLAGVPRVDWVLAEPFFARLRRLRADLPVWTGEIYLEYHRGIYTTHGDLKAGFRAAERGLQTWEAAHCAARLGPIDAGAWRRMVFAQFHDAIPGSSINEVYAQMRPELRQLAVRGKDSARDALRGRRVKKECLFNPLPLPLPVNRRGPGKRMSRVVIPPMSGVVLADAFSDTAVAPVKVSGRRLSNGLAEVSFNSAGEIVSLELKGRPVDLAGAAGQLWTYPDHPHAFDAWEIDRHTLKLGRRVAARAEVAIRQNTPLAACISFTRHVGKSSRVVTNYRLEAGSPVLQIEYLIDWREPQFLLKTVFPTLYRGQAARFGAPFGSVLRDQRLGPAAAEAQWEVPGSRWALVSDDGEQEGLFVVTEDKYGFGCREGRLDVSLLRSALITGEGGKQAKALPPSLQRRSARPRYSDIGTHQIRLAVGRWQADLPRGEMPAALADTLFTDCVAYQGAPCDSGLVGISGGDSLVPAWAKPLSGTQWLLRLHETMGRRGEANLELADGWRTRRVGILDRPGPLFAGAVAFDPYQVVSVILEKAV